MHNKLQMLCWASIIAHAVTGATWIIILGWLFIAGLDFSHSRRALRGGFDKQNKKTKSSILLLNVISDVTVAASFYFGLEQDNFYWVKLSLIAIFCIVCLIDDDIDGHFGKFKKGAKSVFWMGRYRKLNHA